MTTVYDVPPEMLIRHIAEILKSKEEIKPPQWSMYAKTGSDRVRSPVQNDWWHYRVAAVLRKLYIRGTIGVSSLSAEFGGKKRRGSAPPHAVRGSRNIIRRAFTQLESLGYVRISKDEKGKILGRSLTPKGRSFLDNISHKILLELSKSNRELLKYL